jgi:proton-translocating NAD(P)+ transhydrogenase subunit alpha
MKLGILKELSGENRVVMLPEGVSALIDLKIDVVVEKGAGVNAYASDEQYHEVGAKTESRDKLIEQSDIIIMINPLQKSEIKKLKEGQVLLAAFNPFFNRDLVNEMLERNITSFSMDIIPRTSRAQAMDILSSQATVAGYKAVLDAANHLGGFLPMFMSAAGTIKPSKVLILGAGVAGLQAIATARKLGAIVEAFDVRSAVKEEVMSLGAKFVEVEGAKDDAAAGGYAVEQTEDFKKKQAQAIHDHCVKADIVICTAQIPGRQAPVLIKKETVKQMNAGSVIVDLAASTGGNCELSKNGETVEVNQVRILGKSDYPSDLPTDASRMFGKNVLNFLKLIIDEEGKMNLDFEDDIVKGTCLTKNKEIVFEKLKA